MTATPKRKFSGTPLWMGLFFLLFLGAALGVLFQGPNANPLLVLSVVGMALVTFISVRQLVARARDGELALAEGERYIETVAELSQDVHAIVETRGRAFLYMNPAVETLLGYPQEAFLKGGLDFLHSLVHPEDMPALREQYEKLVAPLASPLGPDELEDIQESSFRMRNHHGEYRWFKTRRSVFVRYGDGHAAEILAVVQDITDQHACENALVSVKKLESLGALTRSSIHDLNNTLMGIQGYADLALEADPDSEAFRSSLEKVNLKIHRASALCRQVLAYSGHGRIQIAPNSLNRAVKDSLAAIESLLPQGCTLTLDLMNDPPLASLDPSQVRSTLLNLVYDAVESVRVQKGEVSILTYVKELGGKEPGLSGLEGRHVCLEVSHTGTPWPPEVLDDIRDPLFSTLHPGYGMGLSAVQGVVKEHQGGLEVRPSQGEGGAIVLYFPLAETAPAIDEGDETTPVMGVSGIVLVVDDESSIRNIIRLGLEGAGFKVIEAEDGVEGFGAFVRHRTSIAAVLLDLTMPRMGGEEVFAEIQKMAPEVPVVLMSGYSEQEATSAFKGRGLAGFLSKPCSVKAVVTVMQQAMAQRGRS